MRKVIALDSTSVVTLIAPHNSTGLSSVLAGVNMNELDSGFRHTTNHHLLITFPNDPQVFAGAIKGPRGS